uniref:Metalloendopeptidase n=1 Tax=Crassostrea virginica TaxID=6565 RepID=A0A8B8B507_CRAVI|nr:protein SpAN-like [Crassostrea virginica]
MAPSSVLFLLCGVFLVVGCTFSEKVVSSGRLKLKRPLKVYTVPWHNKKDRSERERRHVIHKPNKERYKDLIGHGGSLIDKKAFDPDSVIADILAGMFVKRNGIERTPHIDFQNSKRFRGQQLDTHKLTHKQKVQFGIESENSSDFRKRRKRNFVINNNSLWTRGIVPYILDASLSPDARDVIEQSIEIMNNLTCVKFDYWGSYFANTVPHRNYVKFFSGSGCWSYVGMIGWGEQRLSLADPGCITIATTIHEMGHALGMWHEQNRRDRNSYVVVYGDNIRGGGLNNINYKMMNTRDSHPYDISSVLQYNFGAFAVDRSQPTMRSKDPRLAFLAGKATGLMFYDAKDINHVYRCAEYCDNPPDCQNGGYVDQYCRCRCPSGLTGTLCTSVVSSPGCGGVISLSLDGEATITSSNYPQNYNLGEECVWLVKVHTFHKELHFLS